MSEELGGLIPLLFVLVFLPGLCVAVTRQAADGLIGMNGSAGIRTRYTKASEEAWVAGHRAALPVVKRMWPVAGVGVAAAVAVQVTAGGAWGIGAAFLALIVQTMVLVRSASARTAPRVPPTAQPVAPAAPRAPSTASDGAAAGTNGQDRSYSQDSKAVGRYSSTFSLVTTGAFSTTRLGTSVSTRSLMALSCTSSRASRIPSAAWVCG